jgi:acetylornithine deacetylase
MAEAAASDIRRDARNGDPVALARLLVSIPSINPALEAGGSGEGEIASICADILRGWGLDVMTDEGAPGRPNVIARLAGSGATLLLNGHLDTVGTDGMTVDPFAAALDGHRLVGRGACDMKGGVAAILAAACRLSEEEHDERPNLVVALTADEEHASLGMARLVEHLPPVDLAVVCEPTRLAVMPAHKGFVWIRATFGGRAAHGSRPDLGIDAIRHAALYLARLEGLAAELAATRPHPLLGHPSFHAGTIRGGSAESIYPERCELVLERRTLPGEPVGAVLGAFRATMEELVASEPDVQGRLEVTLERPGTEVPADAPLVRGLLDALERRGRDRSVRGMSAWVDAAYLNEAGVPAVCMGPGDIEQAHTRDEWIDVREIEACAEVLVDFARGLVSAPR